MKIPTIYNGAPEEPICRCKWEDRSKRRCPHCEEIVCDCTQDDHECEEEKDNADTE